MSKEQKSMQVLVRMSEGRIKSLGGDRWLRRRYKSLLIAFILAMLWFFPISLIMKGAIGAVLSLIPLLVGFIALTYAYRRAGNKLWGQVKDKEQPVDLG